MSNVCVISGRVSDYGPKISWNEAGKPSCAFTVIVPDGTFKTFVNVCCAGLKTEEVCERLEPGSYVEVSGKLMVMCFGMTTVDIATLTPALSENWGQP
jgi:hypothetical protein